MTPTPADLTIRQAAILRVLSESHAPLSATEVGQMVEIPYDDAGQMGWRLLQRLQRMQLVNRSGNYGAASYTITDSGRVALDTARRIVG